MWCCGRCGGGATDGSGGSDRFCDVVRVGVAVVLGGVVVSSGSATGRL